MTESLVQKSRMHVVTISFVFLLSLRLSSCSPTNGKNTVKELAKEDISLSRCEWPGGSTPASSDDVQHVTRVASEDVTEGMMMRHIRRGQPLIVSGVIEKWPAFRTWTAANFIERFGQYGMLYDWAGGNQDNLTVDNYAEMQNEDQKIYVAWVAGESDASELNHQMTKDLSYPTFLPEIDTGWRLVDWMYTGAAGTGAAGHRDSVCHGTWAAQFKGRKQWCMTTYPDKTGRQQHFVLTQDEGDLLLFSVPTWHSTYLLSDSMSVHGYFPLSFAAELTQFICDQAVNDSGLQNDYGHCFAFPWYCHGHEHTSSLFWLEHWLAIGLGVVIVMLSCVWWSVFACSSADSVANKIDDTSHN